jgi:PPK2 family polyphosphate:nucleotide phosphotransferase
MKIKDYTIDGSEKFKIKNFDTTIKLDLNKEDIEQNLIDHVRELAAMQDMLYAQDNYGMLIIIQSMDTAGKDGIIKHVMSGLNPQATQVHSFKQPGPEELDHTWLWKAQVFSPNKGNIAIFNRSYYEEVLVVRIHNLLTKQKIPSALITEKIWEQRYDDIRNFEKHLNRNGIEVVKLFLNLSKNEQKNRLLDRIEDKSKNWKFSEADLKERAYWDNYMEAYEDMINATSTEKSPWYVIPADKKKCARLLVSQILIERMKALDLAYPVLPKEKEDMLLTYKQQLINDK